MRIRKHQKLKGKKVLYEWFECTIKEVSKIDLAGDYKIIRELGKLRNINNCVEIIEKRKGKDFKITLSADKFSSKDACIETHKALYGTDINLIID